MAMCPQHPASEKLHNPLQIDFVRVAGRYRVGKLLGYGGSGECNPTSVRSFIDTALGSVYLGKDIKTGAEVALKIGGTGHVSSRLKHEYTVYTNIAGSAGISPILWYGKEGPYEVIVMNNLGESLSDFIDEEQFDSRKVFLCASQMVRLRYLYKQPC